MSLDRRRVLAFRLAAQGLTARDATLEGVAAGWSLQDSPPGTAALALHARVAGLDPGALDAALQQRTLVRMYNARTATAVVPAAEAAAFAAAHAPRDEPALRAVLGSAVPDDYDPYEATERGVVAIREALDGRALSRDDLHEELRRRLPEELLPWCEGCQSHHARRGLLGIATLRGELLIAGRAGRQPAFGRPADVIGAREADADAAAAELVRRHLRAYAPSTPQLLAEWAGVRPSHARTAWALVTDELVEAGGGWALAADAAALDAPPEPRGVRLLPPGDPFLLARDRDVLVPDADARRRAWRSINAPGVIVADGDLVATWRPRKQGRRLGVAVEPFGRLTKAVRAALEEEAAALAPHRGCTSAAVEVA